jgi:hypothetical protein
MYAYNIGYRRKQNVGRPCKIKTPTVNVEIKKRELFESFEANKEIMNLANLAYHYGRLTKKEYDIACFLESVHTKSNKNLGVKSLSSSAPHTWNVTLQGVYNNHNLSNNTFDNSASQTLWRKIKNFVVLHNPKIAKEFFEILSTHHSYEELCNIKKLGMFNMINSLKEGLQSVETMIDNGLI